ncbi:hypothetical protein KU406_24210, partial [Salmonella enterica subsp. enterica serovar Montevideo]|nr:hypothetical protein [Salmonella enterica subsp. enterica serovar Montevideo]
MTDGEILAGIFLRLRKMYSEQGGANPEHFGLDFRGINVVRLTVVLPEGGRFGVERIDSHQVLQFGKRR